MTRFQPKSPGLRSVISRPVRQAPPPESLIAARSTSPPTTSDAPPPVLGSVTNLARESAPALKAVADINEAISAREVASGSSSARDAAFVAPDSAVDASASVRSELIDTPHPFVSTLGRECMRTPLGSGFLLTNLTGDVALVVTAESPMATAFTSQIAVELPKRAGAPAISAVLALIATITTLAYKLSGSETKLGDAPPPPAESPGSVPEPDAQPAPNATPPNPPSTQQDLSPDAPRS